MKLVAVIIVALVFTLVIAALYSDDDPYGHEYRETVERERDERVLRDAVRMAEELGERTIWQYLCHDTQAHFLKDRHGRLGWRFRLPGGGRVPIRDFAETVGWTEGNLATLRGQLDANVRIGKNRVAPRAVPALDRMCYGVTEP